jgi:cytochrome c oxidase subunit 2
MLSNLNVVPKLVASRFALWTLLISVAGFGLSGCRSHTVDSSMRGEELFHICMACHGQDGAGSSQLAAPNIAGMEEWYIARQIQSFRAGIRGADLNDREGKRMRPMALVIPSGQDVEAVTKYVANLSPRTHAPVLTGDVQAGSTQYHQVCAACHGANGGGSNKVPAPRLAGVDDWYLATQLRKFKTGVRGANPRDAGGRMMAPMARTMASEDAIRNVVAYIGTLKP